ncbi:MAG: TlpA family protein disulfide reductase [Lachnospiraceae bacterium]|nr:TlpA family protein disulfide reductase [Lachnospiraceae bacterium]
MKRRIITLLLSLLIFTLAGCANMTSPTGTGTSASEDAEQTPGQDTADTTAAAAAAGESDTTPEDAEREVVPAIDFQLKDQFGEEHALADYRGKVIFLNFWATWCPPCRQEMPDIQKLYEEYSSDPSSEVVILGVAGPGSGGEKDAEAIAAFLADNGYTYPVLMDEELLLMRGYGISAYPTTFMIDREGNLFGYVTGMLSEEVMRDIIDQTLSGST